MSGRLPKVVRSLSALNKILLVRPTTHLSPVTTFVPLVDSPITSRGLLSTTIELDSVTVNVSPFHRSMCYVKLSFTRVVANLYPLLSYSLSPSSDSSSGVQNSTPFPTFPSEFLPSRFQIRTYAAPPLEYY